MLRILPLSNALRMTGVAAFATFTKIRGMSLCGRTEKYADQSHLHARCQAYVRSCPKLGST